MKVLILVLSSNEGFYFKLKESQQNTWDSIRVPNMMTMYYSGDETLKKPLSRIPPGVELGSGISEVVLPVSDEYNMMHWKFKKALDFVWDMEWDYIFRTNSSTYVRKEKIYEFLKDKPRQKYYAGVDGGGYASGTGAILSRDCAELIKDQFTDEISPSEDSLIGVYLQRNEIFVQEGPVRLSYNFAEYKILEADYYRCKSEVNGADGKPDRNYDIIAFNELQKFHYGK